MNYIRLFNTIKFLKPIQIYYRLYYFIRNRARKKFKIEYSYFKSSNSNILKLQNSIKVDSTYHNGEFRFLNLSKRFKDIDWNYSKYGKLWTYNLTYFDFLSIKDDIFLIYDFIDKIDTIKDGLEPFPISLRGVNWIKYLSSYNIKDKKIDDSLYAQYYILMDNLEYHLLGNHLLENGFSLLFGAYYFHDEVLYTKSKEILLKELDEQILDDGGHFELTPMYHQIMLFRLLDCINLLQNNSWRKDKLLEFFILKAQIMLGWLEAISYKDGNIPLFNDSANKIAPTTKQLFDYARRLNIKRKKTELKESGYRKISKANYESVVDIGEVGASYIPGHAHADTFSFELYIKNRPFIVDMGLSTYETNNRRITERSTLAHNTVEVNGQNQSEVWSGFRVGERANIIDIKENKDFIEATHNGYKPTLHTRRWTFSDKIICIEDYLTNEQNAIARLHFHPSVSKSEILEKIEFNSESFLIKPYKYSPEFNIYKKALCLEIKFTKELFTKIML